MLKLVLASVSIFLQILFGMIEISLLIEQKEDAKHELTEEEQEEKMQNRKKSLFTRGVMGLLIAMINYTIAAFE